MSAGSPIPVRGRLDKESEAHVYEALVLAVREAAARFDARTVTIEATDTPEALVEHAAPGTSIGRADGIPLYAVETVRMLLADGRLAIAQERLVSSLLRMRLLAVLSPPPREQRPRVPEQQHPCTVISHHHHFGSRPKTRQHC